MTFAFTGTRSQATTAEEEVAPSQAEIESEIAKLKDDSARDVQRQLKQQRLAAREGVVEEGLRKVAEDVEEGLAPVWKAAEQGVETIIKDAEADVKDVRRLTKHESTEIQGGHDGADKSQEWK